MTSLIPYGQINAVGLSGRTFFYTRLTLEFFLTISNNTVYEKKLTYNLAILQTYVNPKISIESFCGLSKY